MRAYSVRCHPHYRAACTQLGAAARRHAGGGNAGEMASSGAGDRVVPNEMAQSKQKACISCSLIKTIAQFVEDGCDNCVGLAYQGDRERVQACTTSSFTGSYVALKPTSSWVAKWQRVSKFVPGAYAISIEGKMPDDIIELFEYNRVRVHAVLATSEKAD